MARLSSFARWSAAAVSAIAFAGAAHAGGTDAGTTVTNTFTLDYSVGATPQPQITNATPAGNGGALTTFTVDRLVDLSITTLDPTQSVAPNSVDNTIRYRLTNDGNDTQAYDLTTVTSGDFTPTNIVITYYVDLNGSGTRDGGETLETYTLGTPTQDVPADVSVYVFVESDVPTATPDGDSATIALVADTLYASATGVGVTTNSTDPQCTTTSCPPGTAVVGDSDGNDLENGAENVLADLSGPNDADNAGDFSASGVLNVVAPTLTASKIVAVLESAPATVTDASCGALSAPAAGNQYSVPEACVLYTISVTNTGSGAASNLDISDILPAEVRFVKAELDTTTGTGFVDDPAQPLAAPDTAGPVLTAPLAAEDCNGTTNCTVELSDAQLGAGQNGQIKIWARVR